MPLPTRSTSALTSIRTSSPVERSPSSRSPAEPQLGTPGRLGQRIVSVWRVCGQRGSARWSVIRTTGRSTWRNEVSNILYHWGRAIARHPWKMIGAWLVVALAVVGLHSAVGGQTSDNFRIPNTEAQDAIDLLDARFPSQGGSSGQIVFATDHGTFADADNRAAVGLTIEAVAAGDKVLGVSDPFDPA